MLKKTYILTAITSATVILSHCGEAEQEQENAATQEEVVTETPVTPSASVVEEEQAAAVEESPATAPTEPSTDDEETDTPVTPPTEISPTGQPEFSTPELPQVEELPVQTEDIQPEIPTQEERDLPTLPEPDDNTPRFHADAPEASGEEILKSLSPEKQEELGDAMVLLMRHAHENAEEVNKSIDGKSASEIVAMAQALSDGPVRFDANDPEASGAAMLAQMNGHQQLAFSDAMTFLMVKYKEDEKNVYNIIHKKTAQEVIDMVEEMQLNSPKFNAADPESSSSKLLNSLSPVEQEALTAAMVALRKSHNDDEEAVYKMIDGLSAAEIIQLHSNVQQQAQEQAPRFNSSLGEAGGEALLNSLDDEQKETFLNAMIKIMKHYRDNEEAVFKAIDNKTAAEIMSMAEGL